MGMRMTFIEWRQEMKTIVSIITLSLALVGVGVGCSGSPGSGGAAGAAGPAGTSVPGNERVAGHWQYVSGPMVAGANIDKINYLDLAANGSGMLFTSSRTNGINGCGSIVFSVLSETVVAASIPDFPDDSGVATQFYEYALPSPNALTLTDAFGNATTFQRANSIPQSAMCPAVQAGTPLAIPDNQQPNYASGLASDAFSLWYSPNAGGALPINPTTGATGTLVSFTGGGQYQWVQALQGSDFWATCWCGGNTDMQRRSSAGALVSSFDLSAAPIHRQLSIEAASYDGANLWVGGYQYDIRKDMLLKLNANVSPPTVLAAISFDSRIQGMAFKSGHLWILTRYVGPELLDVDPATGTVRASYTLPHGFYYHGLTALNGKLYALRSNNSETVFDILPISGL
jgi:hypothetical protein